MIGLKQGVGAVSSAKSKVARQRVVSEMQSTGNHGKTSKRNPTVAGHHAPNGSARKTGLVVSRVFSKAGINPFDEIEWERRIAEITDDTGKILFRQEDVEAPKSWSVLATNVVVSKYFYGEIGTAEREQSARQLIHRVTRTIADWGKSQGYFAGNKDAETFYDELTWLCVNQYGSFNSPVWFNCGLHHLYNVGNHSSAGNYHFDRVSGTIKPSRSQYEYPQCSACFIQSVGDTMEDIMELARSEAMLFKYGSGTGTDLSTLRSSCEKLSGGGRPSGPMSFLKVYDAIASVVKSGGKTRRAAKMNTLKVWHPDIKEFIEAKINEEKKAWALIERGYSGNFNGDAYGSVLFQNENLSVRVTDDFMRAVLDDRDWQTHLVTNPNKPGPTYKARALMRSIAEGTWTCGDPGVQYEDTIQRWHTCKNTAPINSSNPCSEYMFLDNSACNLASLNLMKFLRDDGTLDVERLKAAVEIFVTAQEILVDNSSYPTETIAANSHKFRPLGLGYANLGSLIMALGLPYDGNEGRAIAGALTAILHLHAYTQSARMAERLGTFVGFAANREPMLRVVEMHRDAVKRIDPSCPGYLREAAQRCGDAAVELGRRSGYRNAQVTVLAPTGTIAFMMDCDTTGVEPDIALVKYKLLAGGGMFKIVNRTVPMALKKLGYNESQIADTVRYIDKNDTIEGAPHLKDGHLPVFDCAFRPAKGQRSIHYMAHLRMMAAVQPLLSGAISKTVNIPQESTVEDVMNVYIEGWKLGLKAVAIYRDGSKRSQPLSTSKNNGESAATVSGAEAGTLKARLAELEAELENLRVRLGTPKRHRLPDTRHAVTHKFDIAGHEGYITVGLFENDQPGELFITMAKEGSTIGGLMDTIGTLVSLALQYGVPLETLVNKFAHQRFEPSGFTKNPDIPIAKSISDYLFRWLGHRFIPGFREASAPNAGQAELPLLKEVAEQERKAVNRPVKELEQTGDQPPRPAPASNNPADDAATPVQQLNRTVQHFMQDAPACDICGAITVRNGACYKCLNCGNSMGCS